MFDFLSDIFGDFDDLDSFALLPKTYTVYTGSDGRKCPVCGHTYSDFIKTKKFGCSECYNTFRQQADGVLKRIHSSSVHAGKIPSRCEGTLKKERMYKELKAQLSQAVQNEDYEQAAKLHKQIKEMESDM